LLETRAGVVYKENLAKLNAKHWKNISASKQWFSENLFGGHVKK